LNRSKVCENMFFYWWILPHLTKLRHSVCFSKPQFRVLQIIWRHGSFRDHKQSKFMRFVLNFINMLTLIMNKMWFFFCHSLVTGRINHIIQKKKPCPHHYYSNRVSLQEYKNSYKISKKFHVNTQNKAFYLM